MGGRNENGEKEIESNINGKKIFTEKRREIVN